MTSWELSPLYRHSHTLVLANSPNLVSLHRDRLVLRSLADLSPIRSWTLPSLPHPLTTFAASPSDPNYVLVYSAKQRAAWVVDPAKEGEVARIEVGNEGCVAMAWARTGDGANPTVMAWAAHHLHLSLFPLPSPSSPSPSPALQPFRILSPKHSPSPSSSEEQGTGYSFRPDGKFLAVLERHQARDVIGVYSTGSASAAGEWALVKSITLPDPTSDLADLSWSPCGRYIAAWSSITDYTVHVFTPTGTLLSTYTPYASLSPPASSSTSTSSTSSRKPSSASTSTPTAITGNKDCTLTRLDRSTHSYVGLGIRTVQWGRDGEWLSIGGWDGKVRVLSRKGWGAVAEVGVPTRLTGGVNVWREPPNWVSNTRGHGILSYDPVPLPHSLTPLPLDLTRPNPRMGVERIVWSESGRWAAVLNAAFPNVIAIFDFSTLVALASNAHEGETPPRPSLHTLLLLCPSSPSPSPPTPALAWQPSRAFSDGEAEVLCWVGGEKGFGMWRAPTSRKEKGLAECVGIPARGDFSAHSLAFAPDGEALVLSSSPSTSTSSTASAEGTFCVAYPVYEGDEVHVPSGGRAAADESLGGAGGRTWTEDEAEEGESDL